MCICRRRRVETALSDGAYRQAVEHYKELLTYVKSAVTRNYSEKSV